MCVSLHWAAASITMQHTQCTQRPCFECMFQASPACKTQPSQRCLVSGGIECLADCTDLPFYLHGMCMEFHASRCSPPLEATSTAQPSHQCLTMWRSGRFLFHHGMCAKGCQRCLVGVVVGRQSAVSVVRRVGRPAQIHTAVGRQAGCHCLIWGGWLHDSCSAKIKLCTCRGCAVVVCLIVQQPGVRELKARCVGWGLRRVSEV